MIVGITALSFGFIGLAFAHVWEMDRQREANAALAERVFSLGARVDALERTMLRLDDIASGDVNLDAPPWNAA